MLDKKKKKKKNRGEDFTPHHIKLVMICAEKRGHFALTIDFRFIIAGETTVRMSAEPTSYPIQFQIYTRFNTQAREDEKTMNKHWLPGENSIAPYDSSIPLAVN